MPLAQALALIGSVVTIVLAMYGLDAWRREHAGRRSIELAEETLAMFYEAADALEHVRNPGSFGSEYRDLVRDPNESNAEFDARRKASIVFTRFSEHSDLFNRIHAMRYRFMAQIGKAQAAPFDELRRIVNDVQAAARMLTRLWPRNTFKDEAAFLAHQELVNKYEAVFGWTLPEEDPIRPRMDAILKDIEGTCRGVITGKGSLYRLINLPIRSS